jgi:hypothetical protein
LTGIDRAKMAAQTSAKAILKIVLKMPGPL